MKSKNIYFAYRSFWPELETVRKFHECGIDTVCFFASNTTNSKGLPYSVYPLIWTAPEQYDFSVLDRQIGDLLSANPSARFICMVDLNPPDWAWKSYHVESNSFFEMTAALCSPQWNRRITDYMNAFLAYAEEHHGSRIAAYLLSCGSTSEWIEYCERHGQDTPFKRRRYLEWRKENGLPDATDIPPLSARLQDRLSCGGLLDLERNREFLDYKRFLADITAEGLIGFARAARKRIAPDKELGAFFGYAVDMLETHNAYEKVLNADVLDFIVSPGTYRDRRMGGGSGAQLPMATLAAHGVRYLHEADHRTHTYNRILAPGIEFNCPNAFPDESATIAGLKREFALALIRQSSIWWFDMWGGFYQGENVFALFRRMKELWEENIPLPAEGVTETAYVLDSDGLPYPATTPRTEKSLEFNSGVRIKLNRTGVPFDIFSLNDFLALPDLPRYRCVVMGVPFEIDEAKLQKLRKLLFRDGRTVIWIGPAGITDGRDWNTKRVEAITGAPFDSKEIVRTGHDGWTSVYVADPALLDAPALKSLIAASGAHEYIAEPLPVFANSRFLAVHCAEGGVRRITLKHPAAKVTELFSGKPAAENTDSFDYAFAAPDTALFRLDP